MNGTKRSVKRWIAMFLCFCIVISGINTGGFSGIFHSDGTVAHAASNYIYFDNGLAGYDKIEYSVDGGLNWKAMQCLAAIGSGDGRYITSDKVNPNYIYVTQEAVTDSAITFRGTDSGRVYDTASNYQLSSASREWGYDYKDFVWTSDAIAVDGSWDCYYAPALAMQYKYNSPDASELFIYNVGWALKKEDPDYFIKLTDTLNYAVSGILMPLTFADTVNAVTYTVNGSETAPISFAKNSWTFTPDSALNPTAPSSIEFTAQYTGTGDMIMFVADAGAEVKVYANQPVTISALDGTALTSTTNTYTDVDENTLYEITTTAEAGQTYTISSADEAEIYSVQVDASKLEDNTKAEDTTLADELTLTHGSQTVFTLPAGTVLTFNDTGACTSIIPNGGIIGLNTTSTGQSKVSVTGGTVVSVTDDGGQPVSASTDDSYKLAQGIYNITVNGTITDLNVGYKGTVTAKPGEGTTYVIDSNNNSSVLGKLSSNINSDTKVGKDSFFTLKAGADGTMSRGTESSNKSADGDSSLKFKYYINTGGGIKPSSFQQSIAFHLEEGTAGIVKVYALSGDKNKDDTRSLKLQTDKANVGTPVSLKKSTTDPITPITFDLSEPGDYYLGSAGSGIFIYYVAVTVIPASAEKDYTFEPFPIAIHPVNGENRTFTGYQYKMEGNTGIITQDVNTVGLKSQEDNAEGCVWVTEDGDGIEPGTKTFDGATATIFDYFSDWELSGKKLVDHEYVYMQSDGDKDYKKSIERSKYNKVEKGDSDDPPIVPITFSENSNSISYAYQGDLWNQAILKNYQGQTSVRPLYFGSNSWFTGNGRYMDVNRYNDPMPNIETGYDENGISEQIKENNSKEGNAYKIPDDRTYLNRFIQDGMQVFNASIGQSNSRGLAGLVEKEEVNGVAQLTNAGNTVNPLFDQDFIEGNNDKHAVYGKVYNDVAFRFKQNEDTGYYEFDSSKKEYAVRLSFSPSNNQYYMKYTNRLIPKADQDSTRGGQFYPFNGTDTDARFSSENLMFGMKLSIPLVTYSDPALRSDLLKFSGDDDVWAYITAKDGKGETQSALAMDIGGTHAANGGVIDMKNGYAVTEFTLEEGSDDRYGYDTGDGVSSDTVLASDDNAKIEKAAFAIATNDGISETSGAQPIPDDVNFFGTTYSGGSGSSYEAKIVDIDGKNYYQVTLNGTIKSGTSTIDHPNGSSTIVNFAIYDLNDILKKVLDEDKEKDTLAYSIDIFYLERGLNSSNLKLAFRDVDISERAVEKQWTDSLQGFNLHDDQVSGEDENVKVNLYREKVKYADETNLTSTELASSVVGGSSDPIASKMVVRAAARDKTEYNNKDDEDKQKTVFVSSGDEVTIQETVAAHTNYAVLSMNGIKLTDTVYSQFNQGAAEQVADPIQDSGGNPLNLKIYVEADAAGTGTEEIDGKPYKAVEPDENGYIPVNAGSAKKSVLIRFNANTTTRQDPTSEYASSTKETWLMEKTNGWLVELYPLCQGDLSPANLTDASVDDITDGTAGSSAEETLERTVSYQASDETVADEHPLTLNGKDMQFVIMENPSSAESGQQWEHRYTVAAVHKDDALSVKTIVSQKSGYRHAYYRKEAWHGLLTPPERLTEDTCPGYQLDGEFGTSEDVAGGKLNDEDNDKYLEKTVKENGDVGDSYITIVADDGKTGSVPFTGQVNKKLEPMTLTDTYQYQERVLELVQEDVLLKLQSSGRSWYQYWNDLADSVPVDGGGTIYDYKYYISPEVVTDNITNYTTKYYSVVAGEEPKPLEPVTKEFNVKDPVGDTTTEKTMTLYPFTKSEELSMVRIVNTPKTDLELTKEWQLFKENAGAGIVEQEPNSITVKVYRSTLSAPGAVLSAPEEFGSLKFIPQIDSTDKYTGSYTVVFSNAGGTISEDITDLSGDGGLANEDSSIGGGLKSITWHAKLKDVPLYAEDGTRYVYYVKEETPLTSPLEDLVTNYDPSEARDAGVDGLIYPFKGNDVYDSDQNLTMTVQNTVPQVKIQLDIAKTDSADPSKPLADAQFTLYEKEGSGGTYVQVGDVVKTGSDGHVNIPLGVFDENKYYKLEETVAPVGYDLSKTEPIEFHFVKQTDGTLAVVVTEPAATGSYYKGQTFAIDATGTWTLTLNLANTLTSYVLPDSGGSGVGWMLLTGSILLAAALLLAVLRRRQSARS